MDTQIDRPSRFLDWAHQTFGDIALDPRERAMRFVEEAVELAHAMEVPPDAMRAITMRVYSRPAGDVLKEIGQALATLELLAKAIKVDADAEATKEFYRVQSIPKEEWAKRHGAKVALGIAR
jgi:NTP pyrophosphatase (non-canonical NTP hydrolase)